MEKYPVHGSKDCIVNMLILAQYICGFDIIPLKILDILDKLKLIIKFIQQCKEPRVAETTLKKKNKEGQLLTPPDFKTYCSNE